jgi:hypothetical protein
VEHLQAKEGERQHGFCSALVHAPQNGAITLRISMICKGISSALPTLKGQNSPLTYR